jgi:hypothetical protein
VSAARRFVPAGPPRPPGHRCVDVHVHQARPLVEALHKQAELLAAQRVPVVSGMRAELGQRLADGRLPGFAGAEPPSPCKGGAGSAGPEVNRSSDRVSAAGA